MNSGYLVLLASQPVGQVMLQTADRILSLLQPFLEKLQPAGSEVASEAAVAETVLKSDVGRPASYASELLSKASGVRDWLVGSVLHPTSLTLAAAFKEGKNAIEDLKTRGLKLMKERPEQQSAQQPLIISVFWKPVESVWRYINTISQPYVPSEAEASEEIELLEAQDSPSPAQQHSSSQSIADETEIVDLAREDHLSAGDDPSQEMEPAAGPETPASVSLQDVTTVVEPEVPVPSDQDNDHQQQDSSHSRPQSKLKSFFTFGRKR